jgi:hypothetical protein
MKGLRKTTSILCLLMAWGLDEYAAGWIESRHGNGRKDAFDDGRAD